MSINEPQLPLNIAESDAWSDEDLQDFTRAGWAVIEQRLIDEEHPSTAGDSPALAPS